MRILNNSRGLTELDCLRNSCILEAIRIYINQAILPSLQIRDYLLDSTGHYQVIIPNKPDIFPLSLIEALHEIGICSNIGDIPQISDWQSTINICCHDCGGFV